MRRCLDCNSRFSTDLTACPSCGACPAMLDGFPAFAPLLAAEAKDFPVESHAGLDAMQDGSFWFRERNALIAALLGRYFPNARSMLEVGCGTGYVLSGIRKMLPGIAMTGSEIHVAGLAFARQRLGSDVALVQMDARHIPFCEEFEVVVAFDVLEHIEEDYEVLSQIAHAVRPGGGVMLSVPQHPFLWSKNDEIAHHKRRYRRGELAQKARAAGLDILFQTSFVSLLVPVMLLQRLVAGRKNDYSGAEQFALPRWMDALFGALLRFERGLIAMGVRLPVGGSRFVIARRPLVLGGVS